MDSKVKIKDEILYYAFKCMYYNNLLIQQCDTWLTAEEGNRNMEACIIERKKTEKINKLFTTLK